ncbi:MAG: serine hydrolase domain-containing protein [Gammaproteobacteria bacterium]
MMTFRSFQTLIAASALILLSACGGGGGDASPGPLSPAGFVATSVEGALNFAVDSGIDGVWVYVDDGVAPPSAKASGVQNRITQAPAREADLFKIASISKLFIAVSAVKLIDGGMLRLSDTLAFWLPAEAARIDNADQITVRQLLLHRSGVPDFDSQAGFSWTRPHTDDQALLDIVFDLPADFEPDARYEYSNTNYLLLGRVLNAALGYHHHDFVQNAILSPLGMSDTFLVLGDTDLALLARGYWDGVDRTGQDYAIVGGSMVSTPKDVGVFIRALATGNLLTTNERSIYRSLFDSFGHSGWLPGFQSRARYYADVDTVVVQFINNTGGDSEQVAARMHDALVTLLRGP